MAISPTCNMCGLELTDFGAILLSPPDETGSVAKFHICKSCYDSLLLQFKIRPQTSE